VRAGHGKALGDKGVYGGGDDLYLLAAHSAVFSCMRVEAGDGDSGRRQAEVAGERAGDDPCLSLDQIAGH